MDVDRFLDDLEGRIDPEVEDALLGEWVDFLEGRFRGDLFSPWRRRAAPPSLAWPTIRINQAHDDFDAMLLSQLAACSCALATGSGAPLAVRCNYGTGILPSLFGARIFMMDEASDTLPTTWPMDGDDAMRRLVEAGVPALDAGLGARTLEMARRFREVGRRYPRIGRYVRVYHPDLQGPMDVCELLWGSSLFVDLYDQPALVHAVLALVTDVYSRFMHAWATIVPQPDGPVAHWQLMHPGRIMLRDDSAMNLSPGMFDEFIRPYDQALLKEFGGGAMHFCGRGDHYIRSASEEEGLYAVNLTQPHLNDMETIFRNTIDKGIVLLGLHRAAAEAALAAGRELHGRVHVG